MQDTVFQKQIGGIAGWFLNLMSKMFTLTSIKTNSWLHTAHSDYTEDSGALRHDLRHGIFTTLIFQHAKSRAGNYRL